MRYFLLPTILVAACAVSAGTQAGPGPITLVCPDEPDPAVTRLCGALAEALRNAGYQVDATTAALRLVVEAETPRPGLLRARLVVEQDGARKLGEKGELSVMDRAEIPPDQIDGFARDLLAYAPLPKP